MTDSSPLEVPPEEFALEGEADAALGAPAMIPPEVIAETGEDEGVMVWQKNRKINALWSINQNRNSWAGVSGLGWRKLANNNDSAIVALTILAAHAKQTQSTVNLREEKDKMIHEMYVW